MDYNYSSCILFFFCYMTPAINELQTMIHLVRIYILTPSFLFNHNHVVVCWS